MDGRHGRAPRGLAISVGEQWSTVVHVFGFSIEDGAEVAIVDELFPGDGTVCLLYTSDAADE